MKTINFAEPDIRDEDIFAVTDLLRSTTRLTDGEKCREFEKDFGKYTGIKYCLTTSSCMSALVLAYMALGIGKGDEVICTAMSHVATAHAIEMVGATPVFIDCFLDGNIDYDLTDKITQRTKAIALVHYNGFACEMGVINEIAKGYGLKIIEDCALALGSKWKLAAETKWNDIHVGNFKDNIGCFSFYPSKHLTTGEGGIFTTNDYEAYKKAKSISSFGKRGGNYDYDINYLGSNFRMSEVQAVLGIQQLKRVEEYVEQRKKNHNVYSEKLKLNICSINTSPYSYVYYCSDNKERNELIEKLKDNNIGCSIYYPHPIPRLSYYQKKYSYKKIWFPNAELIADCSIALPVHPKITEEEIDFITNIIKGEK